jgi:hypothetical protein
MPSSSTSRRRVLTTSERDYITWALQACNEAGYVRASQVLERVLARDSAERAPRLSSPAMRWHDGK